MHVDGGLSLTSWWVLRGWLSSCLGWLLIGVRISVRGCCFRCGSYR